MKSVGMLMVLAGCTIAVVGALLMFASRFPWLGNLPGDIHYRGKNTSFHFPVVTCIIVSIALTIILNLLLRFFRR